MRLIGIIYFLLFCGFLSATSTLPEMIPELNVFIKRIKKTSNRPNNIKFNSDGPSTAEIIRNEGYPAETHVVMTEDGYLLTVHRIPGGNSSLPVLLIHGLLSSSADYLVLGKGKALGFLLADEGYDVWLGNMRGNLYSRTHISLSPSNLTFWDFSYNEMGMYDLPAIITYITNMRSQPLHAYIGHSMGTTSFYIMGSKRPEIVEKVRLMISFSPTTFMDHMKSPIIILVPLFKKIKIIMDVLFYGELMNRSWFQYFAEFCNRNYSNQRFCLNVTFIIGGFNHEQFNYTLLPLIMNHVPSGASYKTWLHYVQGIESRKFRPYDYGCEKNLLMYNSVEPPEYDLSKITVPIFMFYGNNDWLVDPIDVRRAFYLLPSVKDIYEVPLPSFNHLDFVWAKDAPKLLYERTLKIIREGNI